MRLREIARPSLGLSANVDGGVCRKNPVLGPSFLLSDVYILKTAPLLRLRQNYTCLLVQLCVITLPPHLSI